MSRGRYPPGGMVDVKCTQTWLREDISSSLVEVFPISPTPIYLVLCHLCYPWLSSAAIRPFPAVVNPPAAHGQGSLGESFCSDQLHHKKHLTPSSTHSRLCKPFVYFYASSFTSCCSLIPGLSTPFVQTDLLWPPNSPRSRAESEWHGHRVEHHSSRVS